MIQNTNHNFTDLYTAIIKPSVSQFKWLDADFSVHRPEFKLRRLQAKFVTDFFSKFFGFPGLQSSTTVAHSHIIAPQDACTIP